MILRLTCSLVDLYVIQTSHCYMAVAQQGHEKEKKNNYSIRKLPKTNQTTKQVFSCAMHWQQLPFNNSSKEQKNINPAGKGTMQRLYGLHPHLTRPHISIQVSLGAWTVRPTKPGSRREDRCWQKEWKSEKMWNKDRGNRGSDIVIQTERDCKQIKKQWMVYKMWQDRKLWSMVINDVGKNWICKLH